jgi:hypothetical protein
MSLHAPDEQLESEPTASLGRHRFASEHHEQPFIDVHLLHVLRVSHFDT